MSVDFDAHSLFEEIFGFNVDVSTEAGVEQFAVFFRLLPSARLENDLVLRVILETVKSFDPNVEQNLVAINALRLDMEISKFSKEVRDLLLNYYAEKLDLSDRGAIQDAAFMMDLLGSSIYDQQSVKDRVLDLLNAITADEVLEVGEQRIDDVDGLRHGYGHLMNYLVESGIIYVIPELVPNLISKYRSVNDWFTYVDGDLVTCMGALIHDGIFEPEILLPLVKDAIEKNDSYKIMSLTFPGYFPFRSQTFAHLYYCMKDNADKEIELGMVGDRSLEFDGIANFLHTRNIPIPARPSTPLVVESPGLGD